MKEIGVNEIKNKALIIFKGRGQKKEREREHGYRKREGVCSG